MQTLEIKVPDDKTGLVNDFLKSLGISVTVKKESHTLNAETIAAMTELKQGNGKKFKSVEALFDSIK